MAYQGYHEVETTAAGAQRTTWSGWSLKTKGLLGLAVAGGIALMVAAWGVFPPLWRLSALSTHGLPPTVAAFLLAGFAMFAGGIVVMVLAGCLD